MDSWKYSKCFTKFDAGDVIVITQSLQKCKFKYAMGSVLGLIYGQVKEIIMTYTVLSNCTNFHIDI